MKNNYSLENLEFQKEIRIGYARVSSQDERQKLGLEIQLEALKDCDIIFTDKQSGKSNTRKEFLKAVELAKKAAQEKQVMFCIYKLDRLSRRMITLANLIEEFNRHDIKLVSLQENIETDSLTGRLLCIVLGYVAEIELENIRFRTKEGLKQARSNGKKLGNPGISKELEHNILYLYQLNELTVNEIAKKANVSDKTVYNVAKRNNLSRRYKNGCKTRGIKVK